ncbi:hypothetical protein ACTMTI_24650 [Nonomuraea sp. H19]|uniref:hypothetical protein n=1 Tax=Nonomuraea sp. H19 TaxID=3452206 RepID=UPI003F8BAC94
MSGEAPEEIADVEHEQMFQRVCAVDVAKDAGKVCVRLPASTASGRRVSKVWEVRATFNAVTELAAQLVDAEIEKVTIESTSDYWRIWFYILESHGLDVQLVNAREAKHGCPGPNCRHGPSSRAPRTARARPARATRT